MKARIYFCLLLALQVQIVSQGQSIEVKEICENIYTEKYPNSNKNLIVSNNLLYSVNERSFSILKIKNEQLINLSDLNLEGELQTVDILNNFAFVTTSPPVDRVYKIDISDLNNPLVIDTLYVRGSYTGFTYHDNFCVNELSKSKNWTLQIYDAVGFILIKTIHIPHNKWPLRKLTEDILILVSNNFIELYLLEEGGLTLIGKDFISDLSYPDKAFMLNDSILIHSCARGGLKVFNLKNVFYWDQLMKIQLPISNFEINREKLVAIIGGHEIRLYDISEIRNPQLLDSVVIEENIRDLEFTNKGIFVTCKEGKIYHLKTAQNNLELGSEWSSYGYITDAVLCDNNLVLTTALGLTIHAHITENEIQLLKESKESFRTQSIRRFGEYIISNGLRKNFADNTANIYRIQSGKIIPHLSNINHLPDNASVFNNNLIYLQGGYIRISMIDDTLTPLTEVKFNDFSIGRFFFHSDYIFLIGLDKGVILTFDQSSSNLEVVGSFLTYYHCFPNVAFYQDYMILSPEQGGRTSDVFDLSNISQIKEIAIIPFTGKLAVDHKNDILFIGEYNCNMYDLRMIGDHKIEHLTEIGNCSSIIKMFISENREKKFLCIVGETSVKLFIYELNRSKLSEYFLNEN